MNFDDDGYNPKELSDQANEESYDHSAGPEPLPADDGHAAPATSPEQSNSDFVQQLYQDVLGRDGSLDAEGSNWWTGALEQGASREEVMQAFYNSDEYKALHSADSTPSVTEPPPPEIASPEIISEPRSKHHHDPDIYHWEQPGIPTPQREEVEDAQPVADDEIQPVFGVMPEPVVEYSATENWTQWSDDEKTAPPSEVPSNEDFVRQTYQNILGREADAEGASFWQHALESGHSREQIIAGFKNSEEYQALHPELARHHEHEPAAQIPEQSHATSNPSHVEQAVEVQHAHPVVSQPPVAEEPSHQPIHQSNGFDMHAMPLTNAKAVASLELKPVADGLAQHGDSAFKLEEGHIMINGMNGHGLEMGRVQIPGTVELGTNTDLKEIRANRNASVINAHNERLQTDEQYAADWYHTRALAGVASVTKDFYEFADGILKRNGVEQGMTDPKMSHLVGYSEEKGVVVRVGSVFTNQLMDAYQNKYDADRASFMDKHGFMVVLSVMTAAVGSGIGGAAAANGGGGLLAGAVETLGEKAVAGVISSGLNGALTGNLDAKSLAVSAVAGAATNSLSNSIIKTDMFSADTSALVAKSIVNVGADLLKNGDLGHALQAGVSTVANNYVPVVKDVASGLLGDEAAKLIGQAATVVNLVNNPVGTITGEINKAIDKNIHAGIANESTPGAKGLLNKELPPLTAFPAEDIAAPVTELPLPTEDAEDRKK